MTERRYYETPDEPRRFHDGDALAFCEIEYPGAVLRVRPAKHAPGEANVHLYACNGCDNWRGADLDAATLRQVIADLTQLANEMEARNG